MRAAVALLVVAVGTTDWSLVVKPVEKQVPRLEIRKGDESGICSGVVINREAGFVLTAAHCTGPMKDKDETSITVNGRHAELARVNELLDLAVVRFRAKDEQEMKLATGTPAIGTEIAVAGFMLGSKQFHVQFGRIAAKRSDNGALVLDSVTLPGDSGGAIINAHGELVAMTNQYYKGTAVGLAVPIEIVRDFVEHYLPLEKKP